MPARHQSGSTVLTVGHPSSTFATSKETAMENFIFVVCRTDKIDYDEYDSFVIVAADEDSARHQHPRDHYEWDTTRQEWVDTYDARPASYHGWANDPSSLTVTCVGVAAEGVSGVISSSFNAG
jgi:hypothetical protein